jgi:hypothetical protein
MACWEHAAGTESRYLPSFWVNCCSWVTFHGSLRLLGDVVESGAVGWEFINVVLIEMFF